MKKNGAFLLLLFLAACGGEKKKNGGEDPLAKSDSIAATTQPKVDAELVGEVIQRIPSPLEISVLLKQSQVKFSRSMLNAPDNVSRYNTNYKKALNLGIYSTDLGYCNIYNQNQEALTYLDAVKEMADGLSIGQYFDIATIRRLATTRNNLDSLLVVTQQNFEKINTDLQKREQSNLSILMLTGGWLESLYLTCEVAKNNPNQNLKERIGDQQEIINQLLLLLSFYNNDPMIRTLIADLNALKKHYEKVKVTYVYNPATMKEVDGILIVDDNSKTTIEVSQETFQSIYDAVSSLRQKMIE